jgi:sugar lactone lactonase YvrE
MNAHVISELPKTSLGEGPLWDANRLIYVDITEGLIHRHNFIDHTHETITVGQNVGFAVIDTEGSVIAGLGNGAIYRLHFGTHDQELLAYPAREIGENLANDGKCDRSGRLWAGTKNKDESVADTGFLARFDGGIQLTEVLYPVHTSNGLAWRPDDTKFYYNDSTDAIWQFDYDIDSGSISNRRAWAQLANDGAVPDGMTVDSQGTLYVAMWGGSRVDVYHEKNEIGIRTLSIELPTAFQVSSVTFGGRDLKTLFITSASVGLTNSQRDRYPDSGRIFAIEMPVPGLPEKRFDQSKLGS